MGVHFQLVGFCRLRVGFARNDGDQRSFIYSSHTDDATRQFLQFVERKESDVFHTTIREPETDPVLAGGNVASPHPSVGW